MPINATVAGKVSRILNLSMKWTARFKLRLLYPKYPFDERLGVPQSRYKFGSDNRTPRVQPAANCFMSSVQLPRSEMSNGSSETTVKHRNHANARTGGFIFDTNPATSSQKPEDCKNLTT